MWRGRRDIISADFTTRVCAQTQAWQELAITGTGPRSRWAFGMAADDSSSKVYIFGGRINNPPAGTSNALADTWVLDVIARSWTQVTSATGPSARYDQAAVWTGRSMLIFGGFANPGGNQNDLWEFLPASTSWQTLTPTGTKPRQRRFHVAVWRTDADKLIVFGGSDGPMLLDLWEYTLDGSWQELQSQADAPARNGASAVWNSALSVMLLFGGNTGGGNSANTGIPDGTNLNDLWSYDPNGAGWKELIPRDTPPPGAPTARVFHTAVWNTVDNSMIVFGGSSNGELGDTWQYKTESNWSQLDLTPSPSPREHHEAVWVPTQQAS